MYSIIDLCEDYKSAMRGRVLFLYFRHKYRQCRKKPLLVLFPENDTRYYKVFYEFFPKERYLDRKVVLLQRYPYDSHQEYADRYFIIERISEKQCGDFLKLFSYGVSCTELWLMSLVQPDERKCDFLIGKKGITFDSLVVNGIMNLDG